MLADVRKLPDRREQEVSGLRARLPKAEAAQRLFSKHPFEASTEAAIVQEVSRAYEVARGQAQRLGRIGPWRIYGTGADQGRSRPLR